MESTNQSLTQSNTAQAIQTMLDCFDRLEQLNDQHPLLISGSDMKDMAKFKARLQNKLDKLTRPGVSS